MSLQTENQIKSYKDLIVWQKAMDLAVQAYELCKQFPKTETYGLIAQATRAAASVPGNIAEGSARGAAKDYSRFLAIARGSLVELETYLLLAVRLRYANQEMAQPVLDLIDEVGRMLNTL